MAKVRKAAGLPDGTLITKGLDKVDYVDVYVVATKAGQSIEDIAQRIFALPAWIKVALRLRHYLIAKPFGLQTGRFDVAGDDDEKTRTVPVIDKNENEIVMGSDDKHLYFRLSVLKQEAGERADVYLSTVVKFNNAWGKVYFAFIRLGHKLVVRSVLKRVGK